MLINNISNYGRKYRDISSIYRVSEVMEMIFDGELVDEGFFYE